MCVCFTSPLKGNSADGYTLQLHLLESFVGLVEWAASLSRYHVYPVTLYAVIAARGKNDCFVF